MSATESVDVSEASDLALGTRRGSAYRTIARLRSFVRQQPLGAVGAIVVAVAVILAIFAGQIASNDPGITARDADSQPELLESPSWDHPFGTDSLGRDVFSRIIYGARLTLIVAVGSVALAATVGSIIGLTAGFARRNALWLDAILGIVIEALMSIPALIVVMAFLAVEPIRFVDDLVYKGVANVIIAIGIITVPPIARIVRSVTLSVREREFVEAAHVIGAGNVRVVVHHILPNVMPIIVVYSMTIVSWAILLEAALNFLGVGITTAPIGHALPTSWGRDLSAAQGEMVRGPWLMIAPGLAITLLVFSFNMLGDAFRDITDPRLTGSRKS